MAAKTDQPQGMNTKRKLKQKKLVDEVTEKMGEESNTVKSMREAMWGPVGYCSNSTCISIT